MPNVRVAVLVLIVVIAVIAIVLAARGGGEQTEAAGAQDPPPPPTAVPSPTGAAAAPTAAPAGGQTTFPPAPSVPDGPLSDVDRAALDAFLEQPDVPDLEAIATLGASDDPRLLWIISDMVRFSFDQTTYEATAAAAMELSGLPLDQLADFVWKPLTDHLIAWDLPAFDGYVDAKQQIFTTFEPRWTPFFADRPNEIDWLLTSWGGVRLDDRPLGGTLPCSQGCIPSLDEPGLTDAAGGDWYPDDAIVFGVEIDGEAVAFPKNIMEVHEMVNADLGGRRIAMPYCTLCGAAQVFLTDVEGGGTGEIVMRTSGLLHRSNKVMFDLTSGSVFDTFTGRAISGPLLEDGVQLAQAPVVTTTWADWRAAHPDTMIVAEDGGIGRNYSADPLRGRDDDGPIFPIGETDPRLGVQDQVLGVVLPAGTPIAFDVAAALAALADGSTVEESGVTLVEEAGGLIAMLDGQQIASHQAFWFAWSQFHPDTLLWEP